MAVDMFIKIGTFKGESADEKHKEEIDVYSYSWGVSNAASFDKGGGGGSGKSSLADFNFMKRVDKASANLGKSCSDGTHIPDATFSVRKSGGATGKGQQDFVVFKFKDVLITSVQQSGSSDDPSESVSFAYGEVAFEYKVQDQKGNLADGGKFSYNVTTHKSS